MELSTLDIFKKLQNTDVKHTKIQLRNLLKKTEEYLEIFIYPILEKYSGYEKSTLDSHNPLLWELGHALYFIEKHALRHMLNWDSLLLPELNNDTYDSFVIKSEERYKVKLVDIETLMQYQYNIFRTLKNCIDSFNMPANYYMIVFVLLHLHMHIESFIFTNQLVYKHLPLTFNKLNFNIPTNIIYNDFITIKGGHFRQGFENNRNYGLGFDNEKPAFRKTIEDFQVSKYKITFREFQEFVVAPSGYENEANWSPQGIRWKRAKQLIYPLYWFKNDTNSFNIRYFEQYIPIERLYNYPVIHVSWYEAEAFANWKESRLLSESEWEYMAKQGEPYDYNSMNVDYKNQWIIELKETPGNQINEIVGNCWEWCSEAIYPYDGFTIDPLYREMSYPFFGFKKICRGGAWCVPKELVYPSYRNAQYPECIKQYIGFRIVKK
jgi:iron(II)-dependent oxidoreductase